MRKCISCDSADVQQVVDHLDLGTDVCKKCYREPSTNNCEECDKHLEGICYPYVCGSCIEKTCEWRIEDDVE